MGLCRFGYLFKLLAGARALGVSPLRLGAPGSGVCGVYEEVLSPSRRIPCELVRSTGSGTEEVSLRQKT